MEITEVHKLNKEQLTNNLIFYIRSYQIILDENKKLNEQLKLCSSSLPLKDKKRLSFEDWKSFLYRNTPNTYLINDTEVLEYELINIYNRLNH